MGKQRVCHTQHAAMTQSQDLPDPLPGQFHSIDDYSEEEVRRVQESGFMPPEEDIAEEMYALKTISRKMTERSQRDEEQQADSEASSSVKSNRPASSPQAPAGGLPGAGGPPKPIAGEKVGIFHPAISGLRWDVFIAFAKVWIVLILLILITFSIYWGSLYNRMGNLHQVKMLVVIEDDAVTDVSPTIGDTIEQWYQTKYKPNGDWTIIKGTDEINDFFDNPTNLSEAILTKVHRRSYWAATHVYPNATLNQLELYKGNVDSAGTAVEFIYETGRDPINTTPYVVTTLMNMTNDYLAYNNSYISKQLLAQLTDDQKLSLIETEAITTPPLFTYFDYRPFWNDVLIAPTQVGLIYLIIISFFLFNFFAQVHLILLPHIKIQHYLLYRIVGNHVSYLIISLFMCCVTAAYQADFTLAFGRGGFVVFWLSTYLTMAAVGGANENMGLLIFAHSPPFLGVWLISFVILNVSPSFSPMDMNSKFYKYGYIFPIHHSNEIYKVIFFDLWKGQLGMNYGVLAAWVVINTALLPLVLNHVGSVMANKARAAAKAAAGGPPAGAPAVAQGEKK